MKKPKDDLSRRERDRLRHREEVLTVAEALFAEQGFHSVTMQNIADKAEFAVGTIYQIFDGKESLYEAILDGKVNTFMAIIEDLIGSSKSPLCVIEGLIDAHVEYFLEERSFFKIYIRETRGFIWNMRASMDESLRKNFERYISIIGRVFKDAVARGELRRLDPKDLTLAFFGVVHSFLSYWVAEDKRIDVEEGAGKIKRIFLYPISIKSANEEQDEG